MEHKTLLEYWLVLYSNKKIILIITVAAMVSAWIFSMILPPVYEAKAVFFVPKEPDTATFFSSAGSNKARSALVPVSNEETHGPYIGILKSRSIAVLVQKKFRHKSVEALMRKDTDFVLTNEFLIEVYARDRDPSIAAAIANSYVKYFNELMVGYSLPPQSQTQDTLKGQIGENQRMLSGAIEELRSFQEHNKTANLDEEVRQLISRKAAFESQLEDTKVKYKENADKILATENELKKELGIFEASKFNVTSPILERLKTQLIDIETKMSGLRVELKELHPDYVILKKNHEEVKKNIDSEIERIIKSQIKAPDTFYENLRRQMITLYIEKKEIEATIDATHKVLSRTEDRVLEIPALKTRLDTLNIEVDRYRKLIETLKLDLEETSAQIKRPPQVAVMVDEATPPGGPVFPIVALNIVVSGLAGLIGGIFYSFFVYYVDETREKRLYRLLKAMEASEGYQESNNI
ncbi:MAG TPA: Wzz/FepE/Etk N-terminal domain-containing protein [Nitrospirota bacterium]|nr:Wzz/FepE/Etk N-terminal domain-containing protein [Nitrospirota bacterium]